MLTMALAVMVGAFAVSDRLLRASGTIGLADPNASYSQDFDTLPSVGTGHTAVPEGWWFVESGSGGNATYSTGTGVSPTGDTYSFGAATTPLDRAFGGLRATTTVVPTIGASFTNNTGQAISRVAITYRGEQYRVAVTNREDRLDFQYCIDAVDLNTCPSGAWTDADLLDFVAPNRTGPVGGALNGNTVANSRAIAGELSSLAWPAGHTLWIRWTDFDAINANGINGADDALAVDDFTLTIGSAATDPELANGVASPSAVPSPVTGSNQTLLTVTASAGANPASTNLTVVADLTSISGPAAALLRDDGTGGDAVAGDGVFSLRVTVPADVTPGLKTLPLTAADDEGRFASESIALTVNQTNPKGVGLSTPSIVAPGDEALLTIAVTHGSHPISTDVRVMVDLTPIGGGAAQELFDDGAGADATAGDAVFSQTIVLPATVPSGLTIFNATVTDAEGRTSGAVPTISFSVDVPTPIHDIQGFQPVSPLDGQVLATGGPRGIVTGVKADGFFMQAAPAQYDADPRTSEAIFVSTGFLPQVGVGDLAWAFGTVEEFTPPEDPDSPPLTRLANAAVLVVSHDHALPPPVTLTAEMTSPSGPLDQLEPLEAMRVFVPALRVVEPTTGAVDEVNASAVSTGVFFGVVDGVARPFREAGIPLPDPLPAGAPSTVPRFDTNPERLRVDSHGQLGSVALDVTAGAVVANLTGPLDYGARTYTISVDPSVPATVTGLKAATGVREPGLHEFTVASVHLDRLFNASDGPGADPVATPGAFADRLAKASLAIRDVLHLPDIIGVQEVEDLATLEALAARLNLDAAASNPQYVAYLLEGHDPSGLDVGVLVKASRVVLTAAPEQVAADVAFEGGTGFLFDRPPLLIRANVMLPTRVYPVTVTVVDLWPSDGIDDPVNGEGVRLHRKRQAEALAAFIHARQTADPAEHLVIAGNFNALQLNDGFVDVFGTIKGTPAPADQVALPTTAPAGLTVVDVGAAVSGGERYSVVRVGNAEEIDHVLAAPSVTAFLGGLQWARLNADFPDVYRNDAARPERFSSHDVPVVFFGDSSPPMLTLPAAITVEATGPAGETVSFVAVAVDAVDGVRPVTCVPPSGSMFAVGQTTVSCSAADTQGHTATGSFTVTVTEPATAGRMHGNGRFESGLRQHEFQFAANERASGAEAGTVDYAVRTSNRGRDREDRFHATLVTTVSFYDLPGISAARHRAPLVDTVVFEGLGTWNGASGYRFVAQATDAGEPGRGHDTFSIVIYDAQDAVVASAAGMLTSGNIQSNRNAR